jgi:hypothetical protein
MGQQLTGVHIFEKLGPIEWEDELIVIQAISALTWKKHHGRIELYCNEEHLESLKKWGVDKIYDKIDTILLTETPSTVDRVEYWTFCKLFVSSRLEPPFVLVDTDLWITDEINFDFTKSFIAYHEESYNWDNPNNFYVNFDNFVNEKYINYFDVTIKPTNVALLFWNDKELLNSWFDIANETLTENRNCELNRTQKTVFLEQWLLPMNAVKLNKPYSVLVPQVYNSSNNGDPFDENLWTPKVKDWDEKNWFNFNKIKHVWGLKKSFHLGSVVSEIFEKLLLSANSLNLTHLGLNDLLDFIEVRSGIIKPKKTFKQKNPIRLVYFTPNLITNNETNFLLKRLQSIYETDFNIEIFVLNITNHIKNNQKIIDKIIRVIGPKNYLSCNGNFEDIKKLILENKIDLCQYDISYHDEDFNILMNELFVNGKLKMIKSKNGVELMSNTGDETKIEYPLLNNVIKFIPDVDYDFSKNELPLHEKIKNRIFYSLDYDHKHIICFVDDILKIPKDLYKIIDSFRYNNNIQFHFFNFLNHEEDESKKIILRLPNYTKIWLENVDYNDFIILSDLILDFTTSYNSISLEGLSYGIPTLKVSEKVTNSDFEINLPKQIDSMILEVKNRLFKKNNSEIIISNNLFNEDYYKFYNIVKNR